MATKPSNSQDTGDTIMHNDKKEYQQTHMTGQVQYMKEGMIITEPLPVVSAEEFLDYQRTKGHRNDVDVQTDKSK